MNAVESLAEQIQKHLLQLPPEKQSEALDFILFLQQRSPNAGISASDAERGQRIKKSLQQLAKMKTFADISNPVEWQKNIRQDRPLPARER